MQTPYLLSILLVYWGGIIADLYHTFLDYAGQKEGTSMRAPYILSFKALKYMVSIANSDQPYTVMILIYDDLPLFCIYRNMTT